jgi:hypothetical protein
VTRRRRLLRNGPLAWLLGSYWVGMCALVVGLPAHERPLASTAAGAVGIALTVRMAVMGVSTDGHELRCVSWFVSRRVPVEHVTGVEVVGYSGCGNRFSDSRTLSMLVIRRTPGRDVVLRGTFARFSTGKRHARVLQDVVATARPSRERTRHGPGGS